MDASEFHRLAMRPSNLKHNFQRLTTSETLATLMFREDPAIPNHTLEDRVVERYGELSGQLRKAADYVISNPAEIATRSSRHVSNSIEVSPATLTRLARALDFDNYEALREMAREGVGRKMLSLSEKAARLNGDSSDNETMLERQSSACIANIEAMAQGIEPVALHNAVKSLLKSRNVLLFGALGSTGIAEYMAYLARYFAPNWQIAGRMGASIAADLSNIGAGDCLFIVTKSPYVKRAVYAAEAACENGAEVVLITDYHQCPALRHATHPFIVPSESPQFFSSYAATLVLLETIIAMLVAASGDVAATSIREVDERNRALGEYWADPTRNLSQGD